LNKKSKEDLEEEYKSSPEISRKKLDESAPGRKLSLASASELAEKKKSSEVPQNFTKTHHKRSSLDETNSITPKITEQEDKKKSNHKSSKSVDQNDDKRREKKTSFFSRALSPSRSQSSKPSRLPTEVVVDTKKESKKSTVVPVRSVSPEPKKTIKKASSVSHRSVSADPGKKPPESIPTSTFINNNLPSRKNTLETHQVQGKRISESPEVQRKKSVVDDVEVGPSTKILPSLEEERKENTEEIDPELAELRRVIRAAMDG